MGRVISDIIGIDDSPKVVIQQVPATEEKKEKSTNEDDDNKKKRAINASGYSNIRTSHKGVLDSIDELPKRKTLLGE